MTGETTPAAVSVDQPNRVLVTFAVDLAESMTSPRWVLCPQRQHSSFLIDSVDPVGCPWCSSGDELERLRTERDTLSSLLRRMAKRVNDFRWHRRALCREYDDMRDELRRARAGWVEAERQRDEARARVAELEAGEVRSVQHGADAIDVVARQLFEWGRVGFRQWDDMVPRGRDLYRSRAETVARLLSGQAEGEQSEHPAPRPTPRTGSFAADGPGPRHFTDEEA